MGGSWTGVWEHIDSSRVIYRQSLMEKSIFRDLIVKTNLIRMFRVKTLYCEGSVQKQAKSS